MLTFTEIEQLLADLEGGALSRAEAIRKLAAARQFLLVMRDKLGNIQRDIEVDPEAISRTRLTLADELFKHIGEQKP
jgi:hypothetical protein